MPSINMYLRLSLIAIGLIASGALRFEITEEEKLLHHNELSIINPESLFVHPDLKRKDSTGTAFLELNVTNEQELESGDFVAVSVNSSSPEATDWIALYCPAESDVRTVVPVKYAAIVDSNPDYATTGTAVVRFQMVNMRSDCRFYLYEVKWYGGSWFDDNIPEDVTDLAIAQSSVVTFRDYNEPSKVRVLPSLSGIPGTYSVVVMWSSLRGASALPKLQWWTPGSSSLYTVPATSGTYNASDMCDGPATSWGYRDIGMINEASIEYIDPLTTRAIIFRVGDAESGWTKNFTLHVPPPIGPKTETKLALFGDMGRGTPDDSKTWNEYGTPASYTSQQLEDFATRGEMDAIFHFGDISYAVGYASVWDVYFHQIEGFATKVPYLVNLGNHEYDSPLKTWKQEYRPSIYNVTDSGGECGVPSTRLLKTPRRDPEHTWWSYDIGNIHIVSMNTEANFSTGSDQLRWIEDDLASVDRCKTPWVILGGHRPMYIDSTYGGNPASDLDVMEQLQKYVEPLMVKHNVNLGVYGHNHAYQRLCSSVAGRCMQRSSDGVHYHPPYPVHMVVGTAGASFSVNANFSHPADFTERILYEYGFARVRTANETHLYWEFVSSFNGSILDTMTIIQSPFCGAPRMQIIHHRQEDIDGRATAKMIILISCMTILLAAMLLSLTSSRRYHHASHANHKYRGARGLSAARGYGGSLRKSYSNLSPIIEHEEEEYDCKI